MRSVPFRSLQHLVVVPAVVGGIDSELIVDSGIGVTLLSSSLAEASGCELTGATYTGRRMSGQEVMVPLGRLPSAEVAGLCLEAVDVGVLDLAADGLEGIGGFLSLSPFRSRALTIDYTGDAVLVEEAESLAARPSSGCSVPLEVELDGPSLCVYLLLDLPGGETVRVEVDMGSDSLILDSSLAARVGVDLDAETVRRVDGRDETGHEYARYFTSLEGSINPTGAPEVSQADPDVMFQDIIHDGLLGSAFLRSFAVTFDLANERLVFS